MDIGCLVSTASGIDGFTANILFPHEEELR